MEKLRAKKKSIQGLKITTRHISLISPISSAINSTVSSIGMMKAGKIMVYVIYFEGNLVCANNCLDKG